MANPLDNANIPEDWLRKEIEKSLSPEELANRKNGLARKTHGRV
jgi:uncharacterized protein with von Willebrand factor type A (vWA) domain